MDRSQTDEPSPARSAPQSELHAAPSNKDPRSSSPALCQSKAKGYWLPDFYSGATGIPGRFSEGLLLRRLQTMTTEKIYEDASRPATLHNGTVSTDCPTLQEAVVAWHRLRPELAQKATIRVIGGPLYTAAEIPRLHYGPKSA